MRPGAGEEAVHDFRVALRRLQVHFRTLGACWPSPSLRGWVAIARGAERLFSPVRNCDVSASLARVLGAKGAPRDAGVYFVGRQRKIRERKLRAALAGWRRMRPSAFRSALRAFRQAAARVDPEAFRDKLESQERAAARRTLGLSKALGPGSPDEAWHGLRKALRVLRYVDEDRALLAGRRRAERLQAMLDLQGRLGDAHDLFVLERKLAKSRRRLFPASPAEGGLRALEARVLARRRALLASVPPLLTPFRRTIGR